MEIMLAARQKRLIASFGGRHMLLHLTGLLWLLCLVGTATAFYPGAGGDDDVNMDFLRSSDARAKADMDRMMLMNTDDPKLRAEAQEAFKEIMSAKRLSRLQECRRTCVLEHEPAEEFAACNAACEASHQPGEFDELPTLTGSQGDGGEAKPEPETPEAEKKKDGETPDAKRSDGEL